MSLLNRRFALAALCALSLAAPAFAQKPKPGSGTAEPPPITYSYKKIASDLDFHISAFNEAGVAVGSTTGSNSSAVIVYPGSTPVDLMSVIVGSNMIADSVIPEYVWVELISSSDINSRGQIIGSGIRIEDGVPQQRLFRYTPEQRDPAEPDVVTQPECMEAIRTYIGWIESCGLNEHVGRRRAGHEG